MLNNETRYKCSSNIKENMRTGEKETYRIIETEPIRNQPRRAESASPLQQASLSPFNSPISDRTDDVETYGYLHPHASQQARRPIPTLISKATNCQWLGHRKDERRSVTEVQFGPVLEQFSRTVNRTSSSVRASREPRTEPRSSVRTGSELGSPSKKVNKSDKNSNITYDLCLFI